MGDSSGMAETRSGSSAAARERQEGEGEREDARETVHGWAPGARHAGRASNVAVRTTTETMGLLGGELASRRTASAVEGDASLDAQHGVTSSRKGRQA